jgi:CRISPR-associated protein Csb2
MSLVLEVEYLANVAFAAVGPDSDRPDWPPQPDRVFSALVMSWAARGSSEPEAEALRWLESQSTPAILASEATPRTAPVSFVPPNDPSSGRSGNAKVMPALRGRQPRRFPAARPLDPVVRFLWSEAEPDHQTLSALGRLAADTAYVGHSASLARCFFRTEVPVAGVPGPRPARRRIYSGRLAELRRAFDDRRRPSPGEAVRAPVAARSALKASVFGTRWMILEDVGDNGSGARMPDIRACAIVAKAIRDALLSGYGKIGMMSIPEIVSGHAANGDPSEVPHLAIVPLSFAGFPHADGSVLGFALVPPREARDEGSIFDHPRFLEALRQVAPFEAEDRFGQRRRILTAGGGGQGRGAAFRVLLSPTFERPDRRSLDPEIYLAPARVFATVTPIVLDRHLKAEGEARQDEVAAQIAVACRNIGLPEPELVVPDKHSAIEGAVSARPSGSSPKWHRWRLPASLASRTLTHAVVRFAEPVEGPVILGAGRFVGLGLCRPYRERERVR